MERPRKPLDGNEDFSISQLGMIPLKRRLEILFASNIIPSRQQLALKYELPEQIIHNVLSHRKYLLENWKYNAEAKPLLTKWELENAIALTELLIEWKRRVQINGLQITDAALTRKAIYLQQTLNGCKEGLSPNWWNNFDINWDYKQFQDYENDSLDMEEILNDLQWMFDESSFQRLLAKFRHSKYRLTGGGSFGRARRDELTPVGIDETVFDDEKDIDMDPNYYNDDDFQCEDYEFVLDEEVVIDALRKELEDLEQAKFQQYLQGSLGQQEGDHLISQDELNIKQHSDNQEQEQEQQREEDEEEEEHQVENSTGNLIEEQHVHFDLDEMVNNNDIVQKINFISERKHPKVSNALENRINKHGNTTITTIMDEPETESSIEVPAVSVSPQSTEPAPTPTPTPTPAPPLKRKPRNLHAIVSLRKDCVRLPAPAEIAQLARKQCLQQLLQESDDATDNDDDMESDHGQKRRKRRKNANSKSKSKSIQNRRSKKLKAKKAASSNHFSSTITDSFLTDSLEIDNTTDDMGIEFDIPDNDLKPNFNFDSYDDDDVVDVDVDVDDDDVKEEMISPMASDMEEFIVESNQIIEKIAIEDFSSSSEHPIDDDFYEQNNNDAEKVIENQLNMINEELGVTKTKRRSFNKRSSSSLASASQMEEDLIMGGSLTLSYDDQYRETPTNLNLADIEEEISCTAIQTKDCLNDSDSLSAIATKTTTPITKKTTTTKNKTTSARKSAKNSNKKLVRIAKTQSKQHQQQQEQSVPSNFTPNPFKRSKRRTDGSDLTLRKDKVRLSQVHLMNDKEAATSSSFTRKTTLNETDVQMIFEPYMGDG